MRRAAPLSKRRLAVTILAVLILAVAASVPVANSRASDPSPAPAPVPAPTSPAPSEKPHPCTAEVKSELTAVIDAQLAAFRANDYAKAYTFAATEIAGLFPQADFEGMVRKAYPVIAHSTGVDYGMAFDTGEEAIIYVRVENTESKAGAQYQYMLKKENGAWKISGVAEVKNEGLSV